MKALNVLISSCTRPEAYDLLFLIVRGEVFGENYPVSVTLYDKPTQKAKLENLAIEVKDCASMVLREICIEVNPEKAFQDVDFAIMLDTIENTNSILERMKLCKKVYGGYGIYLEKGAKQSINIVIAGDPVNINAYFMSRYAPSLPKSCFTGCLRMEQNRATFQVAKMLDIPADFVRHVIIWGNSGQNILTDISHAEVQTESGLYKSATKQINNDHWRKHILQPYVENKQSEKLPASEIAICKAKAIVDHIKDLWFGTSENWSSMVVNSSGEYGTPKNMFFGFPVSIPKPKSPPQIITSLKFGDWEESQFEQSIHETSEHSKILNHVCEDKEIEETPCLVSTEYKY